MKIIQILAIGIILGGASSCQDKKEGCTDPISIKFDPDAEKDDGSCQYGGIGGVTELDIYPQFNGHAVWNRDTYQDTAYLKFNAITSPGINPAVYDLVVAGNVGENHVHFFNIKPGKYYLYVTGWDTIVNMRVAGGMPIVVNQASGVVNYTVATLPQ